MTGLEGLIPYLIGAAVYYALQHFGLVPKQPAPAPAVPAVPGNPLLDELLKKLRDLIAHEQDRAQQEASQRIIEKLGKTRTAAERRGE